MASKICGKNNYTNNGNNGGGRNFFMPLSRSTCISWHLQLILGDFVGEKLYYLYAVADSD